jgi:hypothetical protein
MRPDRRLARGVAWLATLVLAGGGGWQIWRAERVPSDGPPPLPSAVVTPPIPFTPPTGTPSLARSAPVKLAIRSIKLVAWIDQVGLTPDSTVETPSFAHPERAAWYRLGPSPGEPGPAVILGHVDTKDDVAVFFYLSRVRPGDEVEITRADGQVVTFIVDRLAQFPKTTFPTDQVYGAVSYPALRLITCGGQFDRRTGNYVDNIVVFAHLASPSATPSRSGAAEPPSPHGSAAP